MRLAAGTGLRLALAGVELVCLLTAGEVWARTLDVVSYPIEDVWPSSVRFLRVDRGFTIREKDDSSGYILFDYSDGPKVCKGALELIRFTDKVGRDATRLAISIPDLPRRYEQMLLDKLIAKLRDDRGPPAPPPHKPEPAPSPPDAAPTPPSL